MAKTDWLSRSDIDSIISEMAAADLLEGLGQEGSKMAVVTFDAAAERLGRSNGSAASKHVRIADFTYLVNAVAEAVSEAGPKSEEADSSPTSAATGE